MGRSCRQAGEIQKSTHPNFFPLVFVIRTIDHSVDRNIAMLAETIKARVGVVEHDYIELRPINKDTLAAYYTEVGAMKIKELRGVDLVAKSHSSTEELRVLAMNIVQGAFSAWPPTAPQTYETFVGQGRRKTHARSPLPQDTYTLTVWMGRAGHDLAFGQADPPVKGIFVADTCTPTAVHRWSLYTHVLAVDGVDMSSMDLKAMHDTRKHAKDIKSPLMHIRVAGNMDLVGHALGRAPASIHDQAASTGLPALAQAAYVAKVEKEDRAPGAAEITEMGKRLEQHILQAMRVRHATNTIQLHTKLQHQIDQVAEAVGPHDVDR